MWSDFVKGLDIRDDLNSDLQVLVVASDTGCFPLEEAVHAAGGRLLDRVGWDRAVDRIEALAIEPLLMLDTRGVDDSRLASTLYRIDGIATGRDLKIICGIDETQIDIASANLLGRSVTLLCDPGVLDWIGNLAVSRSFQRTYLSDRGVSDAESARLTRLNAEVARIADVLSRLARRDAVTIPEAVAETRIGFVEKPGEPIAIDPHEIRQVIRARRQRDRQFGQGLFEDPAWDMMLDLFAAHLERSQVSVSSLCIAAAVAPTTALRWISKMTDAGLFERQPDPFDRRRAFMGLSQRGLEGMRAYVSSIRSLGLPLV